MNSQQKAAIEAAEIFIYFAEFPPEETTSVKKFKLDIQKLKTLFEAKGYFVKLRRLPWVRVLRDASLQENSVIFGIIKTQDRENDFHWIKPILYSEAKYYLVGRNNEKYTNLSPEEIIMGEYKAVCGEGTVYCSLLREVGFKEDKIEIISPPESIEIFEEMVLRGRVDFAVKTYDQTNLLPDKLNQGKGLAPLIEMSSLKAYLAAPKSINPDLLKRITEILKNK